MRAAVFSGGGAKGCFQVGALQALFELGARYDHVFGVSTGALTATMVAQEGGASCNLLEDLYRGIEGDKDIYTKRFLGILRSSLYDNSPLKDLIRENVNLAALRASACTLSVGAVDLVLGDYREVGPDNPDFFDWLIASTSIPVAFSPVLMDDGSILVDGGVRNIAPLRSAIKAGAHAIDVILCSPMKVDEWTGKITALKVGTRSLDILMNEILLEDVHRTWQINKCVKLGANGYRQIDVHVWAPTEPVCGSLEFDPEKIRAGIQQGYWTVKNSGSIGGDDAA